MAEDRKELEKIREFLELIRNKMIKSGETTYANLKLSEKQDIVYFLTYNNILIKRHTSNALMPDGWMVRLIYCGKFNINIGFCSYSKNIEYFRDTLTSAIYNGKLVTLYNITEAIVEITNIIGAFHFINTTKDSIFSYAENDEHTEIEQMLCAESDTCILDLNFDKGLPIEKENCKFIVPIEVAFKNNKRNDFVFITSDLIFSKQSSKIIATGFMSVTEFITLVDCK